MKGILLFLFMLFGAQVLSDAIEIDLIFETGLRSGITQELVYQGDVRRSQLDWVDRAVPLVGITAHISESSGFFSKLGLSFAVPVRSGTMENRDFLLTTSALVSHYSWHEIFSDRDFSASIKAGYEFRFGSFHITPSVGFRYHNRKWTAIGGYLQYPVAGPWTGMEPRVLLHGPVVSYEQNIWFPFAALQAGFSHVFPDASTVRLAASVGVYPFIRAEAEDVHFLRNTQFNDSMRGGIGWNVGITAGFFPRRSNGLGFAAHIGYEAIVNVRGTTTITDTGISAGLPVVPAGWSGGTDISQWYFSLKVSIPVLRR